MDTLEPSSTVIEERLTKPFPTDWIERRARAHGVLIRDRKVEPIALVWSLVLGFAIGNDRAIEELRRTYIRFADQFLHPSSFHDRLTAELADLLRELIDEALQEAAAPQTMADQLDRFRDLVVADATVFRLHDLLADDYPATHDDQAGAKLHLVHNVTDGTLERLDLTDERTHESSRFKNGSWLEGRLLLFDLGYFKHHRFARIDENGGFFVSRMKRSSNPEIVEELGDTEPGVAHEAERDLFLERVSRPGEFVVLLAREPHVPRAVLVSLGPHFAFILGFTQLNSVDVRRTGVDLPDIRVLNGSGRGGLHVFGKTRKTTPWNTTFVTTQIPLSADSQFRVW